MQKNLRKILLIVFAVAGVIFLNKYLLGNFLQNLFYRIVAKPGVFFTAGLNKLSGYGRGFLNAGAIIMENARLREENNSLLGYIAEIENLRRENEFLRNELKVAPKLKSQLLFVEIFSIQRNGLSSIILINKGEKDGIKKSMAVISSGNILVGIVDRVFEDSALVLLLDDPRAAVSVRIQGSDVLAETRGDLQNNFKVDLVTQIEEVKEGSMIVTSGLDGLPESLLVGRISEVKLDGANLFKKIMGKALFDLSLRSGVFVILR